MAINNLRQQNIFDQFGMMNAPAEYGMDVGPIMGPQGPPMGVEMPSWDFGGDIPPDVDPRATFTPNHQAPTLNSGPVLAPNTAIDLRKRLNEIYTPDNVAYDRFNHLLDAPPERGRQSLGRTLVASGMAFGGTPLDQVEKVMQAPYLRDAADWKLKADPYYQAANLERQNNINERTLANNIMTQEQVQRRTDETTRANMNKEEITRARNSILWAKQNGATFETKGRSIIVHWPDGTITDSGVPTTNFDPIELESLRQKGREIITDKEVTGRNTAASIRANAPSKAVLTPTQQKSARDQMLQQIWDTEPANRKYLTKTKTGWELTPPSKNWVSGLFGGTTAAEKKAYADLTKRVYPETKIGPGNIKDTETKPGNQPIGGNNRPPQQAATIPKGRVAVVDAKGNVIGSIPDTPEQRELARKKNLRVR